MTTASLDDIDAVELPSGWSVRSFKAVTSTNALALNGVQADLQWVVAGLQTAGRGRRGRHWTSPQGNLHATAVLVDPCEPARLGELPFVAAVAACDAIRRFEPEARIKWPNDVLAGGAKVAGLLLESGSHDGALRVACGFGVNAAHAPEQALYPTKALAVPRAEAFEALAHSFARALDVWKAEGFAGVRARWLERATGMGGPVTVRLGTPDGGTSERRGTFENLDDDGALVLRLPSGLVERIHAGDIFFPVV